MKKTFPRRPTWRQILLTRRVSKKIPGILRARNHFNIFLPLLLADNQQSLFNMRLALFLGCMLLLCSISRTSAELEYTSATEACVDTDKLYQVGPDFAQVSFNLQRGGADTLLLIPEYALYAVNADCAPNCAPQIILPANSTLLGQCSWMWTPFSWTFTVRNVVTGMDYTGLSLSGVQLGEHGMYNINAVFSADAGAEFMGLNVVTAAAPANSMTALWIWMFAIFLPIIILNFTGAQLAIWLRQRLSIIYRACVSCVSGSGSSANAGYDAADDADSYHLLAESGAVSTPRVKFDRAAANTPQANYARHAQGSFWEAFMSPTAGSTWQDKASFDDRGGASGLQVPLVDPAADTPLPLAAAAGSAVYRQQAKGDIDSKAGAPNTVAKSTTVKPAAAASAAARLDCLDTFRGMCLTFMIFVNYGGGSYWFFDHAAWNGLTFADLLFPWFMWVMGVSMALSMKKLHTDEYRGTDLDPYCKSSGGATRTVTLASSSAPGTADKRYVMNTLEHGSAAGWSQLESEPSSPVRTAENSGGTPAAATASSTAKGPRELALAQAAGLEVTPPQTPLPRNENPHFDPQGAVGGTGTGGKGKGMRKGPEDSWVLWKRVLRRVLILLCIGLFLNNGYQAHATGHWRFLGVLQYFSVSTLLVAGTVLTFRKKTAALLAAFEAEQLKTAGHKDGKVPTFVLAGPEFLSTFGSAAMPASAEFNWTDPAHWLRLLDLRTSIMWCYRYEYAVMATLFSTFLIVCLGVAAPGCPAGYNGPGGRASEYADEFCTGGIHRYIDMQLVGYQHIYHSPTCIPLYGCQAYDPEGVLGMLTAAVLTYFGLVTGRILMHYPSHSARLWRWGVLGSTLCFTAACFCGFSQNDGMIPVNKNLWSASFGLLLAGGGMLGLSVTYVFVDYWGWWTGAPFRYYGLNSILLFCSHEIFQEYFPFEWAITYPTHMSMLTMNICGVALWGLVARFCYSIKFFVKV